MIKKLCGLCICMILSINFLFSDCIAIVPRRYSKTAKEEYSSKSGMIAKNKEKTSFTSKRVSKSSNRKKTDMLASDMKVSKSEKYAVSTLSGVDVHMEPQIDSLVIGKLNYRDTVKVLQKTSNWMRISYGTGEGWVNKNCVVRVVLGKDKVTESYARVSLGKSFYVGQAFSYVSSDPNVASVSKNGVVTCKSKGSAIIVLKNSNGLVTRNIQVRVRDRDPLKFVYTTPNSAKLGESIKFVAITYEDCEHVRFNVGGELVYADSCVNEGLTKVWTAQKSVFTSSNVKICTEVYIQGAWTVCSGGSFMLHMPSENHHMISTSGINFIARCEGYRPNVYVDSYNSEILNIGYGHILSKNEIFYESLRKREAYAMLVNSINNGSYTSDINEFLLRYNIKVSDHQFDALVSFSYNLGTGWLYQDTALRRYILNAKDLSSLNSENFASEFLSYCHAGGVLSRGLLYRRLDELNIFFDGIYLRHTYLYNPREFRLP